MKKIVALAALMVVVGTTGMASTTEISNEIETLNKRVEELSEKLKDLEVTTSDTNNRVSSIESRGPEIISIDEDEMVVIEKLSDTEVSTEETPDKYRPTGYWRLGYEEEDHHNSDTGDMFEPAITTEFKPFEDSNLKVFLQYKYRHRRDKEARDKDKRQRSNIRFSGYTYTNGKFTFQPAFGIRHEAFAGQSDQNYTTDYRFRENMYYQFNEDVRGFISGYMAYVDRDAKSGTDNDKNGYFHEFNVGANIKLANGHTFTPSIFNELNYRQSVGTTGRFWQVRLVYGIPVTEKTTVTPFTRIDLDRWNSGNRVRAGFGVNHEVTETFVVGASMNYETRTGSDSERLVTALQFTQKF